MRALSCVPVRAWLGVVSPVRGLVAACCFRRWRFRHKRQARTWTRIFATGEFGPALQAAEAISDVGLRDRWLGRIAVRQAELGARDASFSTLSDIQSDLARRDAIRSLADHPVGCGRWGGDGRF